ncbi:DUF4390 domain-containing protein [Allochromatium palmeri]|uniref:DUF4390 domain-containing protein n=1 Tax=Allochromatium palmeri TaxID=231048 RepID=A0A6N8EAU8_9GAMM|nr:DUF4390 domain-containing protein [Allochromatium palmeri]MTW19999.1 DUF4390 domain-containing protein [Allochromatium palmeri]
MSTGKVSGFTLILVVIALLALAADALARTSRFNVEQAQTREQAGQILMSANIGFDFSEPVLEALDHGVPLTLVVHVQVRRTKAWMWEDSLVDEQWRYAIRYRPLSERYEVYRLPGSEGRDFVTRDAAIRALGELTDQTLISRARLDPDADYELQIKVFLDIEELPLPLRPMAYLTPSWKLSSGWTKWPLNH